MSLEIELKKKDTIIIEKNSEIVAITCDLDELQAKNHALHSEIAIKNSTLESEIARANSLEEENLKLLSKRKLYMSTIKKQKIKLSGREAAGGKGDITEVKEALAQKKKLLADAENRNKTLAGKLAEIQNQVASSKDEIVDKYRKNSEKLGSKTKDVRKLQDQLKKSEKRLLN